MLPSLPEWIKFLPKLAKNDTPTFVLFPLHQNEHGNIKSTAARHKYILI